MKLTLDAIYARCEQFGACLVWQGPLGHDDRPHIYCSELHKMVQVRRVVVALRDGKDLLQVLSDQSHRAWQSRCTTAGCVKGSHLRSGTKAEQFAWLGARGRLKHGEARRAQARALRRKRPDIKLSIEIVRAMRASPLSNTALAAQYGVHHSLVARIRRNEFWVDGAAANSSIFNLARSA